jgi:hypothetical protein
MANACCASIDGVLMAGVLIACRGLDGVLMCVLVTGAVMVTYLASCI